MEFMTHLCSCLHNSYELLFPSRHAKLEQTRNCLTIFALVLNADSNCFIPTQLTIKDLRSQTYCFLWANKARQPASMCTISSLSIAQHLQIELSVALKRNILIKFTPQWNKEKGPRPTGSQSQRKLQAEPQRAQPQTSTRHQPTDQSPTPNLIVAYGVQLPVGVHLWASRQHI